MADQLDEDTPVEEVIETADEQSAPTMDDTIRNTLAEIEARGSESEPEEETQEQKAERVRDEKGRFATKDAAQEQKPENVEQDAPAQAQPDPVAAPVVVPPEVQRLGLRKEEAEAFAQASEGVKAAFIRRSEEMHRGLEQFREKAQFGDAMVQAIQPFAQTIQSLGVHPAQAVQKLMAADHSLRYGTPQQKQQMIATIARDYGVDLSQGLPEAPYVDPNVSALQQQVQQLTGWIQQKQQVEEQRQMDTLNSEVQQFASDPANKHFNSVVNEMMGLLQANIVTNLRDAYDRAVYANPATRAQVLAEQQAQAEAKRKADATAKAQEAKRAAAVNVSRRGSQPAKRPVGSMEDTIRETAERLGVL